MCRLLARSCVLSCLLKVDNKKKFAVTFLNYKPLKLRVFLGHTVAMVTKMITTCSPVIGQFFSTMIVAPSDKEWL